MTDDESPPAKAKLHGTTFPSRLEIEVPMPEPPNPAMQVFAESWRPPSPSARDFTEVVGLVVSDDDARTAGPEIEIFAATNPQAFVIVTVQPKVRLTMRHWGFCPNEPQYWHPYGEILSTRKIPVLRESRDHDVVFALRRRAVVVFPYVARAALAGRCEFVASAKFTGRDADLPVRIVDL